MPGKSFALRYPARHHLRVCFQLAAFLFLAACESFPLSPTEFDREFQSAPFVQLSQGEAWVSTRNAQVVLERQFRGRREQHILLPNQTSLSGENFILMRSHGRRALNVGRFQPLELLSSVGGIPVPFNSAMIEGLQTRTDALGQLDWTEWSNYGGLTCVLAFRRFDGVNRTIPAGAGAMDLAMRNCVNGTAEDALAPIGPAGASFSATSMASRAAPDMLSPLAGPLP